MKNITMTDNIVRITTNKEDIHEELSFTPLGKWPNQTSIDRALIQLLVHRLQGKYLPMNVRVLPSTDMLELHVDVIEPRNIHPSDYNNLYIGGIDMRGLDTWAYSPLLLSKSIIIDCTCRDGTTFSIHQYKNSNFDEKRRDATSRIYRAIRTLKPEWNTFKITRNKNNTYYINSDQPSRMEIGLRDLNTMERIQSIIGAKDAEKFFLHRTNERSKAGMTPYHLYPYNPDYDLNFLEQLSISNCNIDKIVNILSNMPNPRRINAITEDEQKIMYGNAKFFMTKRFKELTNREHINISDVLTMYLRYMSMGDAGQQTHTPTVIAELLHNKYNIRYEGFASPINAQHKKFCSLMTDVDSIFGSLGNYSADRILEYQDANWSINPPFTEYYHHFTISEIQKAISAGVRKDILFFVEVPNWVDEPSVDWLKSDTNPYRVAHAIMPNGNYIFQRVGLAPNYKHDTLNNVGGDRGMLISVISPLGKHHPTFNEQDLDYVVKTFSYTAHRSMKENAMTKPKYIGKYALKSMLKKGVNLSEYKLANDITPELIESLRKEIEQE